MIRYACPPWYECRCELGKPVSRTTMRSHRAAANRRRQDIGRGSFRWGPKLPSGCTRYVFDVHESLEEHESEEEIERTEECTNAPRQISTEPLPVESAPLGCSIDGQQHSNDHRTNTRNTAPAPVFRDEDGDFELDIDTEEELHTGPSSPQERSRLDTEISNEVEPTNATPNENELQGLRSNGSRIQGLIEWMWVNRKWIDTFYKHGLEHTVMDDILQNIGAPCKSWKTIISNIIRESGFSESIQFFPACPGHMAFVELLQDSESAAENLFCSECSCRAPDSLSSADQVFGYIPLLPRFQAIAQDENLCRSLYEYRWALRERSYGDCLFDYYDGTAYRELLERHGGEDAVKFDIFIAGSADGFQAYKNRRYDIWLIAAVNFNLAPDVRYLVRNLIPVAFVPGPSQPKNLQSFLIPFVNEICKSHREPFQVSFYDGEVRPIRFHLIYFSGDQQGVCKSSGLVGYNGRCPCRDCLIEGVYFDHYYFPSRVQRNGRMLSLFDIRNLPKRTSTQSYRMIADVERLQGRARQQRQRQTGISMGSVLFSVPGIDPYHSFPQDTMHTFQNVQKELLRIKISANYDDAFSLLPHQIQIMDEELQIWGKTGISGELAVSPRPLSRYSDWKASELKHFTLSYSLVLFDGHLPSEYLDGLRLFADVVDICSCAVVTRSDVHCLRQSATGFFEHYERMYYRYMPERVNLCKSVFHALLHLADCMERFGPLSGISQYWLERKIGWIGDRLNARIRAGESMFKSAVFGEAYKIFFKQPFYENKSGYSDILRKGGLVLLGPSVSRSFSDLQEEEADLRKRLCSYLLRKYERLDTAKARQILQRLDRVKFFSRMKFVCGADVSVAGALWALHSRAERRRDTRPFHFVAVEMDETGDTADVYYGRLLRIFEVNLERVGNGLCTREEWMCKHTLVYMDWATGLSTGRQSQVFKNGRSSSAFSSPTVEDASIVRRHIGVVEHCIPSRPSSTPNASSVRSAVAQRTRKRTYFLDSSLRVDKLLSSNTRSADGVNRQLRGLSSRQ